MALDKLNRIYCFVIIRYNDIFEVRMKDSYNRAF